MTSLAYLHDCHSCYDERSIDPKKKPLPSARGESVLRGFHMNIFLLLFDFQREQSVARKLFSVPT